MHAAEVEIDEELAASLVSEQFPDVAGLRLRLVEPWGTDNAIWRLGDDHVVRFPRIGWAGNQPEKEDRWLPVMAGHLAVAGVEVPQPVGLGEPAQGYPHQWSLHTWLEGVGAGPNTIADDVAFAHDVVRVIRALREVPVLGAPPPTNRARPLAEYDEATRKAIDAASHLIDGSAALAIWEQGLAAEPANDHVWVHGDIEGNCLTRNGQLTGLIDWGAACVGDPAVDVQVAWSPLFTPRSRDVLLGELEVDDNTVRRAKAMAINQACAALPYYLETYPLIVERSWHKLAELGVQPNERQPN